MLVNNQQVRSPKLEKHLKSTKFTVKQILGVKHLALALKGVFLPTCAFLAFFLENHSTRPGTHLSSLTLKFLVCLCDADFVLLNIPHKHNWWTYWFMI